MQQYTLQSTEGKLLQDGMYVIQLNNGEQHYVQATSAVLSSATAPTATAITINPTDQLHSNAYLQQNQLAQTIQTIQPQEATVIHQQPNDSFQDVLDYIQHLYTELAKEKDLKYYLCLFCAQDFNDLRSLLRHTSFSHRTKILDGTISLEQDFEAVIRKKIEAKEQENQNPQLYQCVQCQQMFNSLEIITEHLTHCQPATATISNIVPSSNSSNDTYQAKTSTELYDTSSANKTQIAAESYVPYGCAQCGRRYHTIKDLMTHMRVCQDDTFYDAANHLHDKNWVEAPKNQHIVINEETTNVVLKTTGLWLMPEPPGQQINNDTLRGFWVMPSSTSEYIEEQMRQQEKLRIEQEQKRIQEEQEEQARLQREEEERLLIQRQIHEEQQKLRIQQQLQEQQKQLLLQQQLQRQSQSVVQTIASVPTTVPIVKSSPTTVISHQNPTNIHTTQRPHSSATNTIIVLNDEQIFSQSGGDALQCIQASDGSYHVIGNVGLNDRQMANATSVIAHTSPTIEAQPAPLPQPPPAQVPRKRRGGRPPKQNHNAYTQQQPQQNENELITLENVYQTHESSVAPVTSKTTNAKRRRGAQSTVETPTISIDSNHTVIQNVDAADIPPQQFYLAYNDNGVLVPIDTTSTLLKNETQNNAVDLSQEQYIIEDLDASRKAQQKTQTQRSKSTARATATAPAPSMPTTSNQGGASNMNAINTGYSGRANVAPEASASDMSAYNIDDLSHLDKPITTEKPSSVVPIKPLKTKPQFMDSFFSFLMNRESNKL